MFAAYCSSEGPCQLKNLGGNAFHSFEVFGIAQVEIRPNVEFAVACVTVEGHWDIEFFAELIGLEPIGPALWQVYFGPVTLGWFDEELFVIIDFNGNKGRNPIC